MSYFITLCSAFLVLLLLNPLFTLVHVRIVSHHARNMEFRLRSKVVEQLQRLSIHYHTHKHSGSLHSKVSGDVNNIHQFTRQMIEMGSSVSMGLAISLAIVAYQDWRVLIFFIATAPQPRLFVRHFRTDMRRRNHEHRKHLKACRLASEK